MNTCFRLVQRHYTGRYWCICILVALFVWVRAEKFVDVGRTVQMTLSTSDADTNLSTLGFDDCRYSFVKRSLQDLGISTIPAILLGGMTAGASTAIVTNPIWVIKTRMQTQMLTSTDRSIHYRGIFGTRRWASRGSNKKTKNPEFSNISTGCFSHAQYIDLNMVIYRCCAKNLPRGRCAFLLQRTGSSNSCLLSWRRTIPHL